jgi:two-component system chemotaxis sensor kinase CheA
MGSANDDELLNEFLAESREHLAGIEADLLAIEEQGEACDETLVNKVFRAAHSIKGGSAFFGLTRIQELAHKTETALAMIRSKEMAPNAEVVNILLQAFDKLREMINDPAGSRETDISEQVVALTGLSASFLPQDKKQSLSAVLEASFGGGKVRVPIPAIDFLRAQDGGRYTFLLRFDLINDVERAGKTPLSVMDELMSVGEIIDARLQLDSVGTLDDDLSRGVPLDIVLATVLKPDMADALAEMACIGAERVFLMDETAPSDASPATAPPAVHEPKAPPAAREPEPIPAPAAVEVAAVEVAPASPAPVPESPVTASPAAPSATGETTLRVSVDVLETLMNLAGELVLSRNQLREALSRKDERAVSASSQRINLVTSDLQEAIMQTRMQPIGNVFGKFPRVVRDLARSLSKEVRLDVEGREVELDKTLIEGLSDPLTHMVRNAVDHGIESPAERARIGKKTEGVVRLRAFHEAGQVVIEVGDDGKGIDPAKVAASALKKGLITPEKLKGLSDKEKAALIFLPGLSTAEKVSDVSGRGVGMDVVKTNLDRLGGKVDIDSQPGRGSLFRIKLPLTLAIIPSLIVTVQDQRFALPQVNVVELIRIATDQVKKRIEVVGDAEVLVLRGSLIPIVRLADVLGQARVYTDPGTGRAEVDRRTRLADRRSPQHALDPVDRSPADAAAVEVYDRRNPGDRRGASGDLNLVVVSAGALQYGLVVDGLHRTEEIVVKPLGRHLKKLQEYAGSTIMGDGRVALILDVSGVAAAADLSSVSGSARAAQLADQEAAEQRQDTHSLLLFQNAPEETCAVPLDLVLRVERIAASQVETTGGRRTMQYRGATLPLVTLADAAAVQSIAPEQELAVVVFSVHGREVGLLGAMPVDVVETKAAVDQETLRQKGVAGSAIIRDKTVLLVDLHELAAAAYPQWAAERPAPTAGGACGRTVLLAEDSDFFLAAPAGEREQGRGRGDRHRDAEPDRAGAHAAHPRRRPLRPPAGDRADLARGRGRRRQGQGGGHRRLPGEAGPRPPDGRAERLFG